MQMQQFSSPNYGYCYVFALTTHVFVCLPDKCRLPGVTLGAYTAYNSPETKTKSASIKYDVYTCYKNLYINIHIDITVKHPFKKGKTKDVRRTCKTLSL